ncbi:hypothetical protein C0J52_05658 [Blattella germanica]|nr:hypothetical protein C0J52_05658 [Blattella germanica]
MIPHNEIHILPFSKYSWPYNSLNYFHNFLIRRRRVHRCICFVTLRINTNSLGAKTRENKQDLTNSCASDHRLENLSLDKISIHLCMDNLYNYLPHDKLILSL